MTAKSVLFVDDEPAVLDGLKRTMRSRLDGLEVYFLSSPKAAFDFVRHRRPDVVVSDIRMPEMNGLDLVAKIKAEAPATKTIMLTGTGDLDAALSAINNAGVFRFYTKPCEPSALAEGIYDALGVPSAPADGNSFSSSIGTAALNHFKIAVIIVDENGRIVFTNNTGAALFAEGNGLSWGTDDRPKACLPEETKQLQTMLEAAAKGDAETLGDGVMAVSRNVGFRPLSVAVSGLKGDAPANHAIVFVSDPGRPNVLASDAIGTLFNLTPAEARLTHALAMGEQLTDAAHLSGVTVSTARTYLKQIFQKTETSRQSELIKLILSASASM